jgi:hypothetical protein
VRDDRYPTMITWPAHTLQSAQYRPDTAYSVKLVSPEQAGTPLNHLVKDTKGHIRPVRHAGPICRLHQSSSTGRLTKRQVLWSKWCGLGSVNMARLPAKHSFMEEFANSPAR